MKTPKFSSLIKVVTLTSVLLLSAPVKSPAVNWATEPTQIIHTASNIWGNIKNIAKWIWDHAVQLNQLTELITENFITKAIRGLNELMVAIQTDISEVLGTIETLARAPLEIFDTIMSIPNSVIATIQRIPAEFKNLYDTAMDTFALIGDAKVMGEGIIEDYKDPFKNYGGRRAFYTKISGLQERMHSQFLKESEEREILFNKWEKEKYGGDSIRMQSTTLDVLTGIYRQTVAKREEDALEALNKKAKETLTEFNKKSKTIYLGNKIVNRADSNTKHILGPYR